MLSIEFEPFSLGKIRRVKDPIPPMGVIVAAGTDETSIFQIADCGLQIEEFSKAPLQLYTKLKGES